jgi:hypothetical protein
MRRLFKKKDNQDSSLRRQRQESDDRMSVSSTFTYRSRRSSEAFNTGRYEEDAKNKAREAQNSLKSRAILTGVTLIVIILAFQALRLTSNVTVQPFDSSTQSVMTAQQKYVYQYAADNYLGGSIRNKDKITVDSSGLSKYLLSKYPQLSSASLSFGFFSNRPVLYIQIDKPALVLTENKSSFAVDDSGRVKYVLSPSEINTSSIPVVTDQSGLQVKQGRLVLPSNNVGFIQMVFGQLAAKGYSITSMTLPKIAGELDVRVAGQPYYIKFNLENNDARQQAGTYLATIANLKSQNVVPAQYIDVRVDGRAYYQ